MSHGKNDRHDRRQPRTRPRRPWWRDQAGLTLAEILVSAAILTIGATALLGALTLGVGGVEASRQSSTAVFLAEQRLEEARSFAFSTAAGRGFTNLTAAAFPAEGYNAIAGYGGFRRMVAVTDNPGGTADTKLVQVTVFYRPMSSAGGRDAETSSTVSTILASR
jgi:Tfp pilus assembly protein PilV